MTNFEDLAYLFTSSLNNRGIIRQNFNEAALLYKYARLVDGDIVEIGRHHGGSTILLVSALQNKDSKVYSIDIKDNADKLSLNLSKLPLQDVKKISIITQDSVSVAEEFNKEVSLVFVDGNHTVEGCRKDVKAWSPLVKIGGYMIFHDVRDVGKYLGIEQIIVEMKETKGWEEVDSAGSTVVMKKII